MDAEVLVRLRANPERVRVGVRRVEEGWMVTITLRQARSTWRHRRRVRYTANGHTPEDAKRAVECALAEADAMYMRGIDLGCGWAYAHPQAPRQPAG